MSPTQYILRPHKIKIEINKFIAVFQHKITVNMTYDVPVWLSNKWVVKKIAHRAALAIEYYGSSEKSKITFSNNAFFFTRLCKFGIFMVDKSAQSANRSKPCAISW